MIDPFVKDKSKIYEYLRIFYMSNMNLPIVSLFASVACELFLMKLGYFDAVGFTFDELNTMFTDICCHYFF